MFNDQQSVSDNKEYFYSIINIFTQRYAVPANKQLVDRLMTGFNNA